MPQLKENGDESLELTLKCHKIVGGYGEGEALVSHEAICFYLTDAKTGANKVLVFPSGKASSVVQIDGLFKLASNKVAPRAMIVKDVETVLIVSAVIANVPLVDRLEEDLFKAIHMGDFVKVDADGRKVTIIK